MKPDYKNYLANILYLLLVSTVFVSCNSYKRLSDDEYLVKSNSIIVGDKKDRSGELNRYLKQKPNKKFLGIAPFYLFLYNSADPAPELTFNDWKASNPRKTKFFNAVFSPKSLQRIERGYLGYNRWLESIGEAPVVYNEALADASAEQLTRYFNNRGYFRAKVDYSPSVKRQHVDLTYHIDTLKGYTIDTLDVQIASPVLQELYAEIDDESLIKSKELYKTQDLIDERTRITEYFRNNGIYNFNEKYITYDVDTNSTGGKALLAMKISNFPVETVDGIQYRPFEKFKVGQVRVVTNYSFDNPDAPMVDTLTHKDVTIMSRTRIKYKPRVITDVLLFNKDSLFRAHEVQDTYSLLRRLRIFQTTDIRFREDPNDLEDNSLIADIYLSPVKKQAMNFDVEFSNSSLLGLGSTVNLTYSLMNAFNGGELLDFSFRATLGNHKELDDDQSFLNAWELAFSSQLEFPRFLVPWRTEKTSIKRMHPRTVLNASVGYQRNIGLDRNSFDIGWQYRWDKGEYKTHNFELFNFEFIKNLNKENYFTIFSNNERDNVMDFYLDLHPELAAPGRRSDARYKLTLMQAMVSDQSFRESHPEEYTVIADDVNQFSRYASDFFIPSTSYTYLFNNQRYDKDQAFHYFRGHVEFSGNILSLFDEAFKLPYDSLTQQHKLFGVPYSQYVKFDIDYRKYWRLGEGQKLAFRWFTGLGLPYGNSVIMPFDKSYFGGGVNFERAWLAYDLGPGSVKNQTNTYNVGNLKITTSLEYRFRIYKVWQAALFMDVGNIWLTDNEGNSTDESALFRFNKFYKELSVSSGVGFRFDFNYFVFRLDMGLKTVDPSRSEGNRWVLNESSFSNATYNLSIAYPF